MVYVNWASPPYGLLEAATLAYLPYNWGNGLPRSLVDDETLQNFIYKHTLDLENVQKNKKKEKGEVTGGQVNSN